MRQPDHREPPTAMMTATKVAGWAVLVLMAVVAALAVLTLPGCGPHLQVARWEGFDGKHAATIRCTANGQAAQAELASDTTLTAREPTPEVP